MNHTKAMEGNQETTKNKNMSIRLVARGAGGGSLAGIILLGGALALVSTFAFKRKQQSKPKNINKCKVKDNHVVLVGEGLSFLVPDSLSPHLNDHHTSSNGTVDTQDELVSNSKQILQIILNENGETNGGNDEETDILEKTGDHSFCDESSIITEKFPVAVADSLLPLKLEEANENNDSLEEVEVVKVDKETETMTVNCNQVDGVYNDWQVPLETDANNQQVLKAAQADDELKIDGKAHTQGEEYDGNGETIIKRKEILVEGTQLNEPADDDNFQNLEDKCDGHRKIILEKGEEPVEAPVVDQTRVYDKPHKGGEECYDDDAGIITEKGEEWVGEVVAANGIHLSEELKAATMYGDQNILCSDGIIINRNETETCDIKITDWLLPVTYSPSLLKPGDIDLDKDLLVEDTKIVEGNETSEAAVPSLLKPGDIDLDKDLLVEDTKILEGNEASEAAVQEGHSKVEEMAHVTQLVEANGDNKEYYKIHREHTNDKLEEADEISVENDQQKQSCEECQKIHINGDQEKYSSGKSLPRINSFGSDGFKVQEFSFQPLDIQTHFKSGKLYKYDSAETTLHMEDINTTEKDGLEEEVIANQIMFENNPFVQSAENDETQSGDDSGDNAAAEGEETVETSLVDIAQQTKLSEEENNDDDGINDEKAVEINCRENFEVGNNLHLPQKDHDYNVDREEYHSDSDDKDVEDNIDEEDIDTEEEDNVEEVEESSQTGDSSLDSNAEAIWPDESVLEYSQTANDTQANNQNFKETEEEDSYVKFSSNKLEDNEKSFETTTLKRPTYSLNLKFWFLSFLVPFLLVLWLSLPQISFFASSHYHLE